MILRREGYTSIHSLHQFGKNPKYDFIATKNGKDWLFSLRTHEDSADIPFSINREPGYVRAYLTKNILNGDWDVWFIVDDTDMKKSGSWKRISLTGMPEEYIEMRKEVDPTFMKEAIKDYKVEADLDYACFMESHKVKS